MIALVVLTLTLVELVGLTRAALYSLTNTHATFYYDLTLQYCNGNGAPTPAGWQSTINPGIPYCEPSGAGRSLEQIGTNQIVALSTAMVSGDPGKWCGKQVQILDASVNELTIPDGPFYIWDACDACVSDPHIDLPAEAFVALDGGVCGNNPTGITVNVLDNNIKEWVAVGSGAPVPSGGPIPSPVPAGQSTSLAVVAQPSVALLSPSAQVVSGQGDLCPTKGQWQCTGTALQMCNYVGKPAHLDWQTINPQCASYCDVTKTPMCA